MAREPTTITPPPSVAPPVYDTNDIEAQNQPDNLCKSCNKPCGHANHPIQESKNGIDNCGPEAQAMVYAFSLMIFVILILIIVPAAALPMFVVVMLGMALAAVFYAFPAPWMGTRESPGCCGSRC